jgi:hypothetical protein
MNETDKETQPAAAEAAPAVTQPTLLTRIAKALKKKPDLNGWALICFQLLEQFGGSLLIVSKAELEILRAAQKQHEAILAASAKLDFPSAQNAFMQHEKDLAASVHDPTMSAQPAKKVEDFIEEFAVRQRAYYADLFRINDEFFPTGALVSDRFQVLVNKHLDAMEEHEKDAYAQYGVAYQGPGILIRELRKALGIAKARAVGHDVNLDNFSPKQMLPFLEGL